MPGQQLRGGGRGWSLLQVAKEAGVSRGMARAAQRRGMLPEFGLGEVDIVLARVAAVCLTTPAPSTMSAAAADAVIAERDDDAIRLTRGLLADPRLDRSAVLLVTPTRVAALGDARDLAKRLTRFLPEPVTVAPVGIWAAGLPSRTGQAAVRTLPVPTSTADGIQTPAPVSPTPELSLRERPAPAGAGFPDGEPW